MAKVKAEDRRIAEEFRALQLQQERRFQPRWYAILQRQTNAVLKSVRENGIDTTLTMLPSIVSTEPVRRELRYLWTHVGYKAADKQIVILHAMEEQEAKIWGFYEVSYHPGWEQKAFGLSALFRRLMQSYFELFGGEKIKEIDETTKRWIRKKLLEAQERGQDYYTMARNMRTDSIPLSRSKVIARTETVGAVNAGQMTAARQTRLVLIKRWINIHDERTREAHQDEPRGVGGQTRPLEEPYSNGLMQPGDPTGGARQVIQCRCVQAFEPLRDSAGRLIRKSSGTLAQ